MAIRAPDGAKKGKQYLTIGSIKHFREIYAATKKSTVGGGKFQRYLRCDCDIKIAIFRTIWAKKVHFYTKLASR